MYSGLGLINQSYSVAFADFVRGREAAGHRIIKLQTGDPDWPTHPHILRAAMAALDRGETKYCDSRGLPDLRDGLVAKIRDENGIDGLARQNVLVTHGAVHGIGMAIRALVSPGDEVIIVEPYWRAYEANVLLAGGRPVYVKTNSKTGFDLDAADVLRHVNERTALIIINTPNNPSGAVYQESQLRVLAEGVRGQRTKILSDEVYESLIFDGAKHFSLASVPDFFENVITAFSFSKTHAMTGWRIGYVVATELLIDQLLKLSQFSVTSLAPFSQRAAIAALNDREAIEYSRTMRNEYQARRDLLVALTRGTWLESAMTVPRGAFYALVDYSEILGHQSSLEVAKRLVETHGVSLTPGIAFGDSMDHFLRLCFATNRENIEKAIEALLSLKGRV